MKTKLTITIDEDLLPDFKDYAESVGESLSQVVEDSLKQLILKGMKKATFSEKWRGAFIIDKPIKSHDPKWLYLSQKYRLDRLKK